LAQKSFTLTIGEEHMVFHGDAVIGRGAGCQLLLTGPDISRRHAAIEVRDEGVILTDLGSFNGVYHNGQRITGPTPLKTGDVVTVGGHSLRFSEGVTAAEDPEQPFPLPDLFDDEILRGEPTKRTDRWSLLHSAGEALLDAEQPERAERVLTPMLLGILDHAGAANADPVHLETVARLSMTLASASRRVRWLNYVLDLYTAAEHPFPASQAKQLVDLGASLAAGQPAVKAQLDERMTRYLKIRRARDPGPEEAERGTLAILEKLVGK
jgi:predicted component of type VI protein secretion system